MIDAAEEAARLSGQTGVLEHATSRRAMALRARGDATAALRAAAECGEQLARPPLTIRTRTHHAHLAVIESRRTRSASCASWHSLAGEQLELVELGSSTTLGWPASAPRWPAGAERRPSAWSGSSRARAQAIALPASARARGLRRASSCCSPAVTSRRPPAWPRPRPSWRAWRDTPLDGLAAGLLAGRAWAAADSHDRAVAALRAVRGRRRARRRPAVSATRRAARCAGSARACRRPPAARRAPAPTALSGREREIAELVAAGRMNKQIAAALALSEKTIEANLSRIYAKVGVRSRAELAAHVAANSEAGSGPTPAGLREVRCGIARPDPLPSAAEA